MNWKRVVVFVLAIGQILMSYFGGFRGEDTFSSPILTPAGYAFAIWGVITLGCVVYGVYQLLPKQRKNKIYDHMAVPLMITFAGFSMWIYAATQLWLWTTVGIFICMLLALWWAYAYILTSKQKLSLFGQVLFQGTFGLYIGWGTVATVLNFATALNFYGYIYPDARSIGVYIVVLLLALAHALYGLIRIRYNSYYFGTILWAFIAVAVRTFSENALLTILSLVAVVIVTLVWLKGKNFRFSK